MRLLIALFLLSILNHEVSASIESYEKYFQDRQGSENGDAGVLREEILRQYEHRKKSLQRMLHDSQEKMDRHHAGEDVFDEDETYDMLKHRMELIEQKLKKMDVLDEAELESMQRREQRRLERRRNRSREL